MLKRCNKDTIHPEKEVTDRARPDVACSVCASSHLCEELVSEDVVQVGSVLRSLGQQVTNELLGLEGQGGGQGVASLTDAPVSLLQVGGLKGGSAQ